MKLPVEGNLRVLSQHTASASYKRRVRECSCRNKYS